MQKMPENKEIKTGNSKHFLPQCTMPNQKIYMDLFGPLRTSQSGQKYIMVVTDAFTKYVELIAIPDKRG